MRRRSQPARGAHESGRQQDYCRAIRCRVVPRSGAAGLDRFISRLMKTHRIPGLSLGIAQNGTPLVSRGYGFRDRKSMLPATPRTIYGIASITKSFTALCILQLEEAGRLRVTDRVIRHLPEFRTSDPRSTRRITLHHLLSHTSGLPALPTATYAMLRILRRDYPIDVRKLRRFGLDPHHPPLDSYEQLLDFLATARYRMLGPPGRYFSYANEAFGLLGAIVERLSGRTYESYLEEEILRPAGLVHSTCDPGIMFRSPEVTTLYESRQTGGRTRIRSSQEWIEDACLRPAGGLRSNVEDLLRYLEIFRTGGCVGRERIVARSSVKKMLRPVIAILPGHYYGYGLALKPDHHGYLVAYHGGGSKGVGAEITVVPEKGITAVELSNLGGASSFKAAYAGINPLLGAPMDEDFFLPPPRREIPRSLREYSGWFCAGFGSWVRLSPVRDHLKADLYSADGNVKGMRVLPGEHDMFRVRLGPDSIPVRFVRTPEGRIKGFLGPWLFHRRSSEREFRAAPRGRTVW
jgi:CubicO group peptidase (beta-lactamase class C family)